MILLGQRGVREREEWISPLRFLGVFVGLADQSHENRVSLEMNFLDIYENENSEKKRRLMGEKRDSHCVIIPKARRRRGAPSTEGVPARSR